MWSCRDLFVRSLPLTHTKRGRDESTAHVEGENFADHQPSDWAETDLEGGGVRVVVLVVGGGGGGGGGGGVCCVVVAVVVAVVMVVVVVCGADLVTTDVNHETDERDGAPGLRQRHCAGRTVHDGELCVCVVCVFAMCALCVCYVGDVADLEVEGQTESQEGELGGGGW